MGESTDIVNKDKDSKKPTILFGSGRSLRSANLGLLDFF